MMVAVKKAAMKVLNQAVEIVINREYIKDVY